MKSIFITLFLAGILFPVNSQTETEFYFDKNPSAINISDISDAEAGGHPMGIMVAKKLKKMESVYTYVEKGTPTAPADRIVVVKPAIYNSVLKLNRYYKKAIKNDAINLEEATQTFSQVLNKALYLYSEETGEFEKYLQKQKKPEKIIEAFALVKFK